MKLLLVSFLAFLTFCPFQNLAQEPATIKVKRESNLVKAVFDNTEYRLMAVDRFGNPKENKITFYKLFVKTGKETAEFTGYGNGLTADMLNYLKKQKKASKLFFTEITVKDENDHLVKLPDVIEPWFPDCKNCERGKN